MANFSPVKNDLKNFNNEFRDSITKQQLKQFKALKSNKKKILFVASLEKCFKYPVEAKINHGKDIEEAKLMKNKGNVEFQKENYSKAFWFYSQAILKSSSNDPGTVPIHNYLASIFGSIQHIILLITNRYLKIILTQFRSNNFIQV